MKVRVEVLVHIGCDIFLQWINKTFSPKRPQIKNKKFKAFTLNCFKNKIKS